MNKEIKFPAMLYHGTTRTFDNHNINKNRTVLNNNYQGDWICYTESKEVAFKYADAARNQNIDKDLILEDMKEYFNDKGEAGYYFHNLSLLALEKGSEVAFEEIYKIYADQKNISEEESPRKINELLQYFKEKYDLDINDFFDLLDDVEGSNVYEKQNDKFEEIMNIFSGKIKEISYYSIELQKKLGFKKSLYQPQVIISEISGEKVLYTDDPEKAKNAKKEGYDIVVYSGDNCVDGVREILIAKENQIKPSFKSC